jgi:hypothetical protein
MTNRFIALVALSLLLCLKLTAQAPNAVKTLAKSFNTNGKATLVLDLPGTIDLKIWDNPNVKIEVSASLSNGSSAMLSELANVGRYNLVATPEGDAMTIRIPNLQKQVKVKGELLKENLTYVVFAPKNIKVDMRNVPPAVAERK